MISSPDLPEPAADRPAGAGEIPPQIHPTQLTVERLLADCDIRFQRRSGPGGQHRNKVETAVRIRHRPTGIEAQASERRQQGENRAIALGRLRLQLALHVRCQRGATIPSALWRRRCVGGRIVVSEVHPDRAALLAESLDCLAQAAWDPILAARQLACTRTQLVRFLKSEPEAYRQLIEQRHQRGSVEEKDDER